MNNYLFYAIVLFIIGWFGSGIISNLIGSFLGNKDKELEKKVNELKILVDKDKADVLIKENNPPKAENLPPDKAEEFWKKENE